MSPPLSGEQATIKLGVRRISYKIFYFGQRLLLIGMTSYIFTYFTHHFIFQLLEVVLVEEVIQHFFKRKWERDKSILILETTTWPNREVVLDEVNSIESIYVK